MDYERLLGLVKARRSIRGFKTDSIPDEDVGKIIEVARWAPSGANSQPWEFVVIRERAIKERIVDIVNGLREYSSQVELTRDEELRYPSAKKPFHEPGYKNAPVFIILCGDPRTKEAYPLLTSLTRGESHFSSSLANAFLYMTLAASSLGLGSQWVSATASPFVQPLLKENLGIPQQLEIYDMLALGYPDGNPRERSVRPPREMVHLDHFDKAKYRSDSELRDFIISLRQR